MAERIEVDAADLARRMAKAAGKVTPQQMGEAAYMLLCCAAMLSDPDTYIEWQNAIEAGQGKEASNG